MAIELTQAVNRVIGRAWYVLGPENEEFEASFAAFCGVSHAVGVANGTDAIELALRALGVSPGDGVATVANAGFYSTTSILAVGAHPIFIDVDPGSYLIDLNDLRQTLQCKPVRCVVVTHLYGRLVDVDAVTAMCDPLRIPVIEDCAQAHGATRDGRRAGSFGVAGCFSFYPTKNLGALGDGGAVLTNSETTAGRVRALRQYGWQGKYKVALTGGRNSRLDEMQAAILGAKLPRLDDWNARRRAIAERYTEEIAHPGVICPSGFGTDNVAHLFVVRCKNRDNLRVHLASFGVGTDVHYPVPDHRQVTLDDASPGELGVTEQLAKQILTLPCFPELTDAEVTHIISAVNAW